jgi:transposase
VREPVPHDLRKAIEPLLPPEPVKPRGGRPRVPDRAALSGIVYVPKTGIPWRMLPKEFGCSGVTCWRRPRDRQKAGVWGRLPEVLRDTLGRMGGIDRSRACLDSASIPAKKGASIPAPIR